MRFDEKFLHFVWQFRLYNTADLATNTGQQIQVLNCGLNNSNAGPDFLNAKIRIDETTWAGNVEIHIKASDWLLHKHQNDSVYDNVVLHVVYEDDEPIYSSTGQLLPCLALKPLIANELFERYDALLLANTAFPCQNQIAQVDYFLVNSFLARVLVERLSQKTEEVFERLNALNGNWDDTFYHFLAKNFGFKINALPMAMLAQSLPQQLFAKHKDQPKQIEALIFGQAGFLAQHFTDPYPLGLQQEYKFLATKYKLVPIDVSLWKFLRMRPQNFPTLRLAQFSALASVSNHLFAKVLNVKDVKTIAKLFEELPVAAFWQTHYHFNKTADQVALQLGKKSIDNLLINTVALFLYAYGKHTAQANFQTRAVQLLEHVAAEENTILKAYISAGVQVKTAFQSQAILQLHKHYCMPKNCLNCGIGLKILKR